MSQDRQRRADPAWLQRRYLRAAIILGIALLGLGLRLAALPGYLSQPEMTMYDGQMLLRGGQSYHYLCLARDLARGQYGNTDQQRNAPQGLPSRLPPPLISVLAWLANLISGVSLAWCAVLLPPVLAVLVVVPAYLLGRDLGGGLTGLGVALITVSTYAYFLRAGPGWFTPDCLSLTLILAIAQQVFTYARHRRPRPVRPLLLAVLCCVLLWWNWDQAPLLSLLALLCPLVAGVAVYGHPRRNDWLGLGLAALFGLLLLVLVQHLGNGPAPWDGLREWLAQALGLGDHRLPVVPLADREAPGWSEAVRMTVGVWPLVPLALGGLVWLAWREIRAIPVLGFLLTLALAGLFSARYLLFSGAAAALGLAYLAGRLWYGWPWQPNPRQGAATAMIMVLCALPGLIHGLGPVPISWLHPRVIEGLAKARGRTPPDAVLWASWEDGFAINYWARRATINDPGLVAHSGLRNAATFLPLALSDQRLAANFIRFYAAHGTEGLRRTAAALGVSEDDAIPVLKRLLAMGPEGASKLLPDTSLAQGKNPGNVERWLGYLFPAQAPPVYLFVDRRLAATLPLWWELARWPSRPSLSERPGYITIVAVTRRGNRLSAPGGFSLDMDDGIMKLGGKDMLLIRLALWAAGQPPRITDFDKQAGSSFEAFLQRGYGVLMHPALGDSLINHLYLRHSFDPRYFRPVYLDSPWAQLWEVKGDPPPK